MAKLPADHMLTIGYVRQDGTSGQFQVRVRIDTQQEAAYFQNGGILPYVLRGIVGA